MLKIDSGRKINAKKWDKTTLFVVCIWGEIVFVCIKSSRVFPDKISPARAKFCQIKNEMKDFSNYMFLTIEGFEAEGKFSTARLFRSSLRSFELFYGGAVPYEALTPEVLSSYEAHLLQRSLALNTVSTYLRMLRATYYRAVAAGETAEVPGLFRGVFTGTRSDVKRALSVRNTARLLAADEQTVPPALLQVCAWAQLMFLLRGIPFADLARLRKCDLHEGIITYRRCKTGSLITIIVPAEALDIICRVGDSDPRSPYLLPILDKRLRRAADIDRCYTSALRRFNRLLAQLSVALGLHARLSSYTLRHTWATTAFRRKVPVGLICNAMGHSSVTVTETYLKPFVDEEIDRANRELISYIKSFI